RGGTQRRGPRRAAGELHPGLSVLGLRQAAVRDGRVACAAARASGRGPGQVVDALAQAAARAGVYAVVGVTEREPGHVGTLYNTNVVVTPEGKLLGKHRKLVPTWGERAVWAGGDGSTLTTFPTRFGPLGTL